VDISGMAMASSLSWRSMSVQISNQLLGVCIDGASKQSKAASCLWKDFSEIVELLSLGKELLLKGFREWTLEQRLPLPLLF
jgi:hypothetical protein